MRVLMIEDDAALREPIRRLLQKALPEGSILVAPESAEEARRLFDEEQYDVLLLDMQLSYWGLGKST